MDSGGILCLHYLFCCRTPMGARMVYSVDVHPRSTAGWGRAADDASPPLGTAGGYLSLIVYSRNGL